MPSPTPGPTPSPTPAPSLALLLAPQPAAPVNTADPEEAAREATALPEPPPPAKLPDQSTSASAIEPEPEPADALPAADALTKQPTQDGAAKLTRAEGTTVGSAEPVLAAIAPTVGTPIPDVEAAALTKSLETLSLSPAAPVTPTPIGADAVTVDALTSDHEAQPGDRSRYRFQLTNTTGHTLAVEPVPVNSLDGWTSVLLHEDGTAFRGVTRLEPWQSAVVVVEVIVPLDAHVGDRNTVSLAVTLADAPPTPDGAGADRNLVPARDPEELLTVSEEPYGAR